MAIYATSDLHGMGGLWDQIKDFLTDEDKLIFLGDAADRGPDGYRMIREMLADPRIVYLKGNHEDFFAKCSHNTMTWFFNGGNITYKAWNKDGADKGLLATLAKLPLSYTYTNESGQTFYLTHAGFTPRINDEPSNHLGDDLLWDRSHFFEAWPRGCDNIYIIHGHTPAPYLLEDLGFDATLWLKDPKAYKYCDGHKIDVDLLSIATGKCTLLNLDNWGEEVIFSTNPIYNI